MTTYEITTDAETNTVTAQLPNGMVLTFSPSTDARVAGAEDGKLVARSNRAAKELASELRSWGIADASALGCAVVFWG